MKNLAWTANSGNRIVPQRMDRRTGWLPVTAAANNFG
jgi:hypothetical protein